MHFDVAEIKSIAERIPALNVRNKMLVSFITGEREDRYICSEMGLMPHQLQPTIAALCSELQMIHLDRWNWKDYIREATLYLVAPKKPVTPEEPAPRAPKDKKYRIKKKTLQEVEPFMARFMKEAERTKDPILAATYRQVPYLLRFAISLCGKAEHAEELVQEGLARAYANLASFQPGANVSASIRAWLFTIIKNFFESERLKQRRTVEDPDGGLASTLRSLPDQFDAVELREVQKALLLLPAEQRETVIGAGLGYSYDEMASAAGCAEGTIKSRLNRGRNRLAELTDKVLVPTGE